MSDLRKILRRLRTTLWTALTLVMLLAAVLVGVGKLLMPYSARYQPQLEAWLSKAFNQPVKVESFSGEWKAFGPRISLQGVTFMSEGAQSEIAISMAALDIKPLNALIPGRPLYSFRIIGADLSLERTTDGRYLLSGLGVSNRRTGKDSNSGLRNVALNGEVRLQDVSLSFDDPEREIHLVLTNINGRLRMDGRNLAAEIQARISDRDRRRVIGDLDAVVLVKLDAEQHLAAARWHIQTGELMLADLIRQLPHHPLLPVSGRLNAEVWGQWEQGSAQQMQGVMDLRDAQLSSPTGLLNIEHLNSRMNFRFKSRDDWRMDLSDLTIDQGGANWRSRRLTVARNMAENYRLWVSADYLELDFPLQLTQRIMASYNLQWPGSIPRRAQGNVRDLDLLLNTQWQVRQASGQIENAHFWGWDKGPDIAGINLQIALEAGVGDISFAGPAVQLDWPRVFRRPLTLALTDCRVEFFWQPQRDWQFDLNHCSAKNEDLSVRGRVRMAASEGKPEVDINVVMERGDLSRFGDYWPENIMTERTLHWLRTSLFRGEVSGGRFSMVGDLDDYPFTNRRGRLQGIVPIREAALKYADNWPPARQVEAVAEFEAGGMTVTGRIGDTGGVKVDKVVARIGNFKQPALEVEFASQVELPQLVAYIKQTPLLEKMTIDPDQFVFTGKSRVNGRIDWQLRAPTKPVQVVGTVQMQDVHFTELLSAVELDGLAGTLNFNREGLSARQMDGTYRGSPINLEIAADWDAEEIFRATLTGELLVEQVIPEDLIRREPLFKQASGKSHWDISLSVASSADTRARETWLELNSDLIGTSIDLPAPMAKPAAASWPLTVRYPIVVGQRVLSANLADRLQLKMELAEDTSSPVSASIGLEEKAGSLPAAGAFVIAGSAALVDLDNWLDLIVTRSKQNEESDGLMLKSATVNARQIIVFDRLFDAVGLKLKLEDEVIIGDFDAADIAGNIRYYQNEAGSHSLTGEFERLIIPDPVAQGISMETDPTELPELHFFSKEFSYLGLELGETRIEGYPVKNGFHFESIKALSPRLTLDARGNWLRDEQGERSDFNIHIAAEDLGALLEAMDISAAIQGGQTLVNFDAWWEGPPAAFALERLNGEMDLSVLQGNILTAEPGAGRVLGLLSLTELPRRLALDFRDVFDAGFSFDKASGTMRFENGTSFTDDLLLSSAAAEISITGSTDLVAQTFDYEFVIHPGVSKTLPVLGAITGGPAGMAAGLALQALLRDSLGDAAEARYTITGPWTDPLVEPVASPTSNQAAGVDNDMPAAILPADETGTAVPQATGEDNNE